MFNSKLKKQIEELEDGLSKLNDKLNSRTKEIEKTYDLTKELKDKIEDLQWRLNNPPKYKRGDKLEKIWIVSSVIFKESINYYKCFVDCKYQYTITNIKTGETKTI